MGGMSVEEQSDLFTPVKKKHVLVSLQEESNVLSTFLHTHSQTLPSDITFWDVLQSLLPGGAVGAQLSAFVRHLPLCPG